MARLFEANSQEVLLFVLIKPHYKKTREPLGFVLSSYFVGTTPTIQMAGHKPDRGERASVFLDCQQS